MIEVVASVGVGLAGLYLVALGLAAFMVPDRAARFLLAFASSGTAHYVELLIRLGVGVALVVRAPAMLFPQAFEVFGWVILVTTAGLFAVPWRWHHRFALRVVPPMVPHLKLLGVTSGLLGGSILVALLVGAGS